jgi:hypothetical protein
VATYRSYCVLLKAPVRAPGGFCKTTWWSILGTILLGGVLFSPAITAPFVFDDYLHDMMVRGSYPSPRGPFDLYDFVGNGDRALLYDRGVYPWWSDPQLTIRFWRPLSSAVLWFERGITESALALHLHSYLWWILLVLASVRFYARRLPRRAALLSTAIFALAPCHALPLAWLANREVLLSLTFGILALDEATRTDSANEAKRVLLTALFWTLALLSGEYALGMLGYFGVSWLYDVFGQRTRASGSTSAPQYFRGLAFALPAVAYLATRKVLGYGTHGSAFYSDPSDNLRVYLETAPRRIVTLALDAFWSLNLHTLELDTSWYLLALSVAASVYSALVGMRWLRACSEQRSIELLHWALPGALLALIPVAAVIPSPRVVGCALFGLAPLMGALIDCVWREPTTAQAKAPAATFMIALAFSFSGLVHGPVTAFLLSKDASSAPRQFTKNVAQTVQDLSQTPNLDLIMVRFLAGGFYLPSALDVAGHARKKTLMLSMCGKVLMRREAATTTRFELIAPEGESLFPVGIGNLFRPAEALMHVGERVVLPEMEVTVTEVNARGVRTAMFTLAKPMEQYVWLQETQTGYLPIALPPPGFGAPFELTQQRTQAD